MWKSTIKIVLVFFVIYTYITRSTLYESARYFPRKINWVYLKPILAGRFVIFIERVYFVHISDKIQKFRYEYAVCNIIIVCKALYRRYIRTVYLYSFLRAFLVEFYKLNLDILLVQYIVGICRFLSRGFWSIQRDSLSKAR